MSKSDIFILILVISAGCLVQRTNGLSGQEILDIIKLAKDIVIVIAKSWNIVDQHIDFSEIPVPLLDRTEHKLFGKIGLINAKVDRIAQQIDATGTSTISTILQNLPERVRLELRLNDLLDYISRMDVMHNRFENYVKKKNDFERLTLEDFAKTAVSHDSNSVNNLIERIHLFIVSNNRVVSDTGLMKLLQKSLKVSTKYSRM